MSIDIKVKRIRKGSHQILVNGEHKYSLYPYSLTGKWGVYDKDGSLFLDDLFPRISDAVKYISEYELDRHNELLYIVT